MTVVGVPASHEQVHPSALLEAVRTAEQVATAGLDVSARPAAA
jgi:predicted secreted Zn-dependent protease